MLEEVLQKIDEACRKARRDPKEITLVAVSKGQSVEAMQQLYEQRIRDFGESRMQEAESKMDLLAQDIRWHLIGTVQTKKVPKIIGRYHLVHSVDRLELAEKISQCSIQKNCITNVLLQVNVTGEASKHGFSKEVLLKLYPQLSELKGIKIQGLMTMAVERAGEPEIRKTFYELKELQQKLKLQHLSMGMSQDFETAIEEGATYLRIGRALFN